MDEVQRALLEQLSAVTRRTLYLDAVHLAGKVGRPVGDVQAALEALRGQGLVRERRDVVPAGWPAWEITQRGRRRLPQ